MEQVKSAAILLLHLVQVHVIPLIPTQIMWVHVHLLVEETVYGLTRVQMMLTVLREGLQVITVGYVFHQELHLLLLPQ